MKINGSFKPWLGWVCIAAGVLGIFAISTMIFQQNQSAAPQVSQSSKKIIASDNPCKVTSVTEHKDIVYKSHQGVDKQFTSLDLYVPKGQGDCQSVPLVVWVHGGGFTAGDKIINDYKKKFFTDAGWALASVNYRLDTNHPGHAKDVAAALKWLQNNQKKYGYDSQKTILVGFSAGAYIVLLLSTDEKLVMSEGAESKNIICTVSLDTSAYDVPAYMQTVDPAVPLYSYIMGTDPKVLQQYSPMHKLKDANHLPAFLLVTEGINIEPAMTNNFAHALRKKGARAEVFNGNMYNHGQFDTEIGVPGGNTLTENILKFLKSC